MLSLLYVKMGLVVSGAIKKLFPQEFDDMETKQKLAFGALLAVLWPAALWLAVLEWNRLRDVRGEEE